MTGIKRLYKLIADIDVSADPKLWYILRGGTEGDWDCEEHDGKTLGSTLVAIADQIKREQGGRVSRMRVLSVVTEMERHVSGVEGAEDSPVARWARELREALVGNGRDHAADVSVSAYDLLPQEDREAAAWIRDHGGLDAVERRWECLSYYADPVPRSCMEKRLARLQRQIDECHEALRRRNQRIEELTHRVSDLTNENAELRRRAMPESCKWPRFEDGELVNLGDRYECWCGKTHVVSSVAIMEGRSVLNASDNAHTFVVSDGPFTAHGKRVKRPSVLAADGEPLEVGQTVWNVNNGMEFTVSRLPKPGEYQSVEVRYRNGSSTSFDPDQLTHQRPVLDADGVPIKKGDTVYLLPGKWCDVFPCSGFHGGEELEVFADGEASHVPGGVQCRETEKSLGSRGTCYPQPSQLTHTKPEPPDSWESIEEDIRRMAEEWCSHPSLREASEKAASSVGEATMGVALGNLSKRCRALAERERGE